MGRDWKKVAEKSLNVESINGDRVCSFKLSTYSSQTDQKGINRVFVAIVVKEIVSQKDKSKKIAINLSKY